MGAAPLLLLLLLSLLLLLLLLWAPPPSRAGKSALGAGDPTSGTAGGALNHRAAVISGAFAAGRTFPLGLWNAPGKTTNTIRWGPRRGSRANSIPAVYRPLLKRAYWVGLFGRLKEESASPRLDSSRGGHTFVPK